MEGLRFNAGPLHDLQRLENDENSEEINTDKHQIQQLEKEIQKLISLRDKLKWKLETVPGKILQRLLCADRQLSGQELSSLAVFQEACDAVHAAKKQKLQQMSDSYRLSGISVKQVKKNVVCLTFDTFSDGEFFELYYMELEKKDQLQIGKHSIPHFVPITNIADKHLNVSLRQFAQVILSMLNAFVARRHFVKRLQRHLSAYLNDDFINSTSYDYCTMSLENVPGLGIPLHLQLMFSLEKHHADQVKVKKVSRKERDLTDEEKEILLEVTNSLLGGQLPVLGQNP